MERYKDKFDEIKFSDEEKIDLINQVKVSLEKEQTKYKEEKSSKVRVRPILKYSLVAVFVLMFSVSAFATDILKSVIEIFSPMFGSQREQIEIIEDMGTVIGISDTHDGITITANAVIGDVNNITVIYTVTNLPENTKYVQSDYATLEFPTFDATVDSYCGYLTSEEKPGEVQIIQSNYILGEVPIGSMVNAKFDGLYYSEGIEGETAIKLSDKTWNIEFKLDYVDTSRTIDVNESFVRNGIKFNLEQIIISPFSIKANYTVDAENNVGEEMVENINAVFKPGAEFFVLKTSNDIGEIDLTRCAGSVDIDAHNKIKGNKNLIFTEIIPLEDITTIKFGDVEINMKDYLN